MLEIGPERAGRVSLSQLFGVEFSPLFGVLERWSRRVPPIGKLDGGLLLDASRQIHALRLTVSTVLMNVAKSS
jgi:hypothetical protein